MYYHQNSIRKLAMASITGYQKYLSPYKGFSCAYRLLYGGESCSQYIKNSIATQGLMATVKAAPLRFKVCREANLILNKNVNQTIKTKRRKNCNINNNCCHTVMNESICCGAEACIEFSLDNLDCGGDCF